MSASPRSTFDIALCQFELRPVDSVDALTDRIDHLLERAGSADCYVLPELLGVAVGVTEADGLNLLDETEWRALHEYLHEESQTRDAVIVGGSYNVRDLETDEIRNRCPIATPYGVETYDKCHPIPGERADGKAAGRGAPPVVEHNGVGVGVLICYDVEFPETVRALVDRGAEVLAVPSWTASEAGYQRVRRCSAARAVENQCYVATVPFVSRLDGFDGTGRSSVFAPCDDVVGDAGTRLSLPRDEEAAATCTVDVDALRRSRREASVRPYTDARAEFDG